MFKAQVGRSSEFVVGLRPHYRGVSSLLAALPLLVAATGCLAHSAADSPARLAAERAKARAAEHRAAELERRLFEVERLARTNAGGPARPVSAAAPPDKLDRLIAAQEQLLERLADVVPPGPAAVGKKSNVREPICRQPSAELVGFEARLMDLYERAQTDLPPWRGGLSREKREALRILLREDRELDSGNPLEL